LAKGARDPTASLVPPLRQPLKSGSELLCGAVGRRETLTNRDPGTVEATAGRMLALVTSAAQGMGPASGWHYHVCEHQLIYVLKGWVDLEAEDGTNTRIETGDSVIIPGGMRHNVSGTANEIEVLTITVPAESRVGEVRSTKRFEIAGSAPLFRACTSNLPRSHRRVRRRNLQAKRRHCLLVIAPGLYRVMARPMRGYDDAPTAERTVARQG
jgi:quercetin dioxygenase-like cupin family protein